MRSHIHTLAHDIPLRQRRQNVAAAHLITVLWVALWRLIFRNESTSN